MSMTIDDLDRQADEETSAAFEADMYKPFPVDLLPETLADLVNAGTAAIGCDSTFIALPVMAVVASCIGTTRMLRLRNSWHVFPIMWTGIIGESGSQKTPAQRLALKPLERLQTARFKEYDAAVDEHKKAVVSYKRAIAKWNKSSNKSQEQPEEPLAPIAIQHLTTDCTVEALAPLLKANPRGVLVSRDELAGWLSSFDKYSAAAGSDESNWLSMFNATSVTINRKTGDQKIIHIDRAAASITGGIQPEVLRRTMSNNHIESGLASRFLFAYPPRRKKFWRDADVCDSVSDSYKGTLERLLELDHDRDGQPLVVIPSRPSKKRYERFYDQNAARQLKATGPFGYALSKLEETPARIALIVHLAKCVIGGGDQSTLDESSMVAGIQIAEWFIQETERCYFSRHSGVFRASSHAMGRELPKCP